MKQYVPVGNFERHTSLCPTYVAWRVLDEARDYFRKDISEDYATELARRAEAVFATHPFWQRKFQSEQGREHLLASMRHWLAGVLARENPARFRQLPESFKIGQPLPEKMAISPQPSPGRATLSHSRERGKSRWDEPPGRARSPRRAVNVEEPASCPRRRARSDAPDLRFVHGCELLAI